MLTAVTIAYLVSRFPTVTETFIVRELDAVDRSEGMHVRLFSLFRGRADVIHPTTARWIDRVRKPTASEAIAAVAWWAVRRPARLASSVAVVIGGHWRRPLTLAKALLTIPLAAAIARQLATTEVDRVHAHWATYPALAAWLCRRLTGVPYSFTAHAHDIYVDQSFLAQKIADASSVVTISEHNREFLGDWNAARTPLELVRYGIEPADYVFRPRAPAREGEVRALCVANLREWKGHAVLLEAMAAQELARVRLDLVGDGPLRPELEAQVHRLALDARVRFLGSASEPEVARLLDAADVFVLPSVVLASGWREGLPVALIEALAAGIPVITTRASGVPELVRDGETGLLAEPGDVASLRAAFARLFADPEAAVARSHAGRRLVEDEFTLERSATQMVELFRAGAAR